MSKKAKIDWADCIYEGEWIGNTRTGSGRLISRSDGRQYCGEWSDNTFNGKGVFSYATGHVFFGTFKSHCPLEGYLYDPSGSVYSVTYSGKTRCWEGKLPTAEQINQISDQREIDRILEDMYDDFVLAVEINRGNGNGEHAEFLSEQFERKGATFPSWLSFVSSPESLEISGQAKLARPPPSAVAKRCWDARERIHRASLSRTERHRPKQSRRLSGTGGRERMVVSVAE